MVSSVEAMEPIEVDARGLRCPLPVIRLAAAARDAPAGTLITVLANDPAARHDIPAWCRMRGHELSEMTEMLDLPDSPDSPDSPDPPDPPDPPDSPDPPDPPKSSDSSDQRESSDLSEADVAVAHPAHPAYLRFVVLVRPQPPKAAGTGSGSERSSRAR